MPESGAGRGRSESTGRGRPAGRGRDTAPAGKEWSRPRSTTRPRDDEARTQEQARYDGPPIDESITGSELDRSIRQQLRGLPEKLATRVARHLVAAGQLIEEDPATAYQHTLAARARAARVCW
jgi:hypothetical protein